MSVGVMTAMAVVAWLPPAHADEMERIGKEGSRFGHGLRRKQEYLGTPTVDESGNTITLTDPAGTQLDINDLMPGQNPDEVNRLKELYDQDPAAM